MSNDSDWWSWIVIGTLFLLTTPVIYVPVGESSGSSEQILHAAYGRANARGISTEQVGCSWGKR